MSDLTDPYKKHADEQGVSRDAYYYLFSKHQHDHEEKLFNGAAVVTLDDAFEAIRIEHRFLRNRDEMREAALQALAELSQDANEYHDNHLRTGCPCEIADTPCNEGCTCRNPFSSYGCQCCAKYGSMEQRKEKAEHLIKKIKEI